MPDKYLIATIGTVAIPDPGPLPAECVFVAKVRGPFAASGALVSQYQNSTQFSYRLHRDPANGRLTVVVSLDGTATGAPSIFVTGAIPDNADIWLAFSMDQAGAVQGWTSTDGSDWELFETKAAAAFAPFDSNQDVRIGSYGASATLSEWDGRIYSVELRTGLDPTQGDILWRFDANDYPGSGTEWTDPRGQTWTLNVAGAISLDSPGQHLTVRAGTAAEWAAANPVLAAAEFGYSHDDRVLKLGDGASEFDALTTAVTIQG